MRIEATAEEDFAVGISACSPPVVRVATAGALTLRVEFADGLQGQVRFLPSHLSGVFEALKDPDYFAQAAVQRGAVTWPGEIDLAPDAMYDAIKCEGQWLLR